MNTFKQLTKGYYYVNSDITEANFPWPKKVTTEGYKIINMGKSYSSQEALDRMKADGCRPATIHELITIAHEHPELFPEGKWSSLVAFGTDFTDSDGRHRVPRVRRLSDGDWEFFLGVFEYDWDGDDCLICFCDNQPSDTLAPETDVVPLTLTDETAIAYLKEKGYRITKMIEKEY